MGIPGIISAGKFWNYFVKIIAFLAIFAYKSDVF